MPILEQNRVHKMSTEPLLLTKIIKRKDLDTLKKYLMMKPLEAEELKTTLVTRKKDLDSIHTSLQYPLNRLKHVARGTHEVILTLYHRALSRRLEETTST